MSSRPTLWEEAPGWLVSPETNSGPTSSWGSHHPLCPRAVLSLLPCISSGGYGEEDPKGKEAQALCEAMPLPPGPRPTVVVSHNKEEKLHSSFLVIPAQGTYGHFKLWINFIAFLEGSHQIKGLWLSESTNKLRKKSWMVSGVGVRQHRHWFDGKGWKWNVRSGCVKIILITVN